MYVYLVMINYMKLWIWKYIIRLWRLISMSHSWPDKLQWSVLPFIGNTLKLQPFACIVTQLHWHNIPLPANIQTYIWRNYFNPNWHFNDISIFSGWLLSNWFWYRNWHCAVHFYMKILSFTQNASTQDDYNYEHWFLVADQIHHKRQHENFSGMFWIQ